MNSLDERDDCKIFVDITAITVIIMIAIKTSIKVNPLLRFLFFLSNVSLSYENCFIGIIEFYC